MNNEPANEPVHVVFVCHGNICRSPMAERIAEKWASDEGIRDALFTSAAISREEIGNEIDPRARTVLEKGGYRTDGHSAHEITATEIREADLVLAMEQYHISIMRRLVPEAANLFLLTRFDPSLPDGAKIEDPWYGPATGFATTRREIEACMPELMKWIRGALRANRDSDRGLADDEEA